MVDSGIILVKYWLNVSVDEQARRLESRIDDPRKIWKLSPTDLKSYSRRYEYCRARDAMLAADRHVVGAVVRRAQRRQEARPAEHHLPPAQPDPVRAGPAPRREATQDSRAPRDTSSPTCRCTASPRSTESRRHTMTATMATASNATGPGWYALSADEVAKRLAVDPDERPERGEGRRAAAGGRAQRAARREDGVPGWRRFLDQYAAYMQIILLIAAVLSLAIGEWSTGAVLLLLTVVNAVVGLRQEGKAESAMNALKSLTKQTARVRRGGVESAIPVEEVVIGDVVLITAGDNVAADGRIIQANSLSIDESALTGESTPASKETDTLADAEVGAGDQKNMAFMNTPVTHGSGTMIVTARGADAQVGKIAGMLASSTKEQTPLTKQLNTMTLWIGAAALGTMIVMFALGLSRGESADTLFITAIALGDRGDPHRAADRPAGDPLGRRQGACRRERHRQGPHARWRRSDRRRRSTRTRPGR